MLSYIFEFWRKNQFKIVKCVVDFGAANGSDNKLTVSLCSVLYTFKGGRANCASVGMMPFVKFSSTVVRNLLNCCNIFFVSRY